MTNDATFDLMKEKMKSDSRISFIQNTLYSIDDTEQSFAMIDLKLSGCYVLISSKKIDINHPGKIYINGALTGKPILLFTPMFGQIIGIKARRYLTKYNCEYKITYKGAKDIDGKTIDDFSFVLKTLPEIKQNERFKEHNKIVLNAAREGIVLLKNKDNTLPLKDNEYFNAFGSGSNIFHISALGAGKINPRYHINISNGIKYTNLKLNKNLFNFYKNELDILPNDKILNEAKKLSNKAFLFISRTSSEAHDMLLEEGGYYLNKDEINLLKYLKENFEKVIVILNTAYQICLKEIIDLDVDAIIWCGLPGMAGGRALLEIINGKINPSGALANSWCLDYNDYPTSKNFFTTKNLVNKENIASLSICYQEGNYIGYKYFVDKKMNIPFIFGSGLSYTTFSVNVIEIKNSKSKYQVTLNCKNIGKYEGKHIITLYAKIDNEPIRLISFTKTNNIKPNNSELVKLSFNLNDLTIFDKETYNWIIKKGNIDILLGKLDNLSLIHQITINDDILCNKSKQLFKEPVDFKNNLVEESCFTHCFYQDEIKSIIPYEEEIKYNFNDKTLDKYNGDLITFKELKNNKSLLKKFVSQMSDDELIRLLVCGKTGWGLEDDGHAGEMAILDKKLEKYGFDHFKMSDGNNGLNLKERNLGFPTSNLMCSTYNKKLMYLEGKSLAEEAKFYGIDCILAPAMNIERNPLNGRNTEYFSEDPYLAGIMAGYQIKGIESMNVKSSLKHFLANNNEFKRNLTNCIINEKTIREIYLKAFEYALSIKHPSTIMTSYNAVNGIYTSNNPYLLIDLLRKEWNYKGIVMTDWNGYGNKGFSYLLKSGVNLITPGSENDSITNVILNDLNNKKIKRSTLEKRTLEVVKVLIK